MSSTTGASASTRDAEMLAAALLRTGLFQTAVPVENGVAVRVQSRAKHLNAPDVPIATATIWLPDPGVHAGYVWTTPTDHELPAHAGLDAVAEAVAATMLPYAAPGEAAS